MVYRIQVFENHMRVGQLGSIMMNAAAPEGTPPRRIGYKISKPHCPAVPRRGSEAGDLIKILISWEGINFDFTGYQ